MHVKVEELQPGAWLLASECYVQFVSLSVDLSLAEALVHKQDNTSFFPVEGLRPIYINKAIIMQCGFRQTGDVYRDEYFAISIGGAKNIYKVIGHRIQKPSVNHLLSQLHVFQNIYLDETGYGLIFQPNL